MQTVAHVLPMTWAMQALTDLAVRRGFRALSCRPSAICSTASRCCPVSVSAAAGAKKLGLPLIKKASDQFERVWQSDKLTVWKSTNDVRVFAKTDAALKKAVATIEAA